MLYSISNNKLSVKISDFGAELFSVKSKETGCEYIWQGDAKYWADRSPTLFPICGQLFGKTYTYNGEEYQMSGHGFAKDHTFNVKESSETSLTLSLSSNEEIKKIYPFDFELDIKFSLDEVKLSVSATIKNTGSTLLPATFGAHPGFNVPLSEGTEFEDYYFEFSEDCYPNQLTILDDAMFAGTTEALLIENNRILRLSHELFKIDGIFMNRMADTVTLKSDKSPRSVTVQYTGFPYLGIWQEYGKDTPFICVEPWCGLPDYEGLSRDIMKKNDMFRLLPHTEKTVEYSMIFR